METRRVSSQPGTPSVNLAANPSRSINHKAQHICGCCVHHLFARGTSGHDSEATSRRREADNEYFCSPSSKVVQPLLPVVFGGLSLARIPLIALFTLRPSPRPSPTPPSVGGAASTTTTIATAATAATATAISSSPFRRSAGAASRRETAAGNATTIPTTATHADVSSSPGPVEPRGVRLVFQGRVCPRPEGQGGGGGVPRGGRQQLGGQLLRPGGEGEGYDRRDALVRGIPHEELQAARAVLGQQLISYR